MQRNFQVWVWRQPEAAKCRPELVLLSAGFDAHHADPVGSLGLETEDNAPLTKMVLDIANEYCDGPMVSVLEGGYNVPVLADCVELHLRLCSVHRNADMTRRTFQLSDKEHPCECRYNFGSN